jgi:hypothetical protein
MPWPRILTADEKQTISPHQGRMEQVVVDASGSVEAGWAWYEKSQGVVAWAFRNSGSAQRSVILLRNSYYFGDAYWSVYSANPGFQTPFLDGNANFGKLAEGTVPQNVAPLGLVQFGGIRQAIVCFIITLAPGQAWAMLERGFAPLAPPSGAAIYDVTPVSGGDFCLGYDPRAVKDWDDQTRTRLGGYDPNPSTFNTWLFQAPIGASYRKVYPADSVAMGRCMSGPQYTPPDTPAPPPQPTYETRDMFPPVFPDVLSPPVNP